MPLQDHRQILRKNTARYNHIAAALLRLQLQLRLHMRYETDGADALRLRSFFITRG